jgi:hypothetical protein
MEVHSRLGPGFIEAIIILEKADKKPRMTRI